MVDFLFRQLFEPVSCTYTYLLADKPGGEGLLIDPVDTQMEQYARLLEELELKLLFAVDTHVHADHVTATGPLADKTGAAAAMGEHTKAETIDVKLAEGEALRFGPHALKALYTPGHTDDSYSFLLEDRVFTGDTLFKGSIGRLDLPGLEHLSQQRAPLELLEGEVQQDG